MSPPKLDLCRKPTPLWRSDRLDELVGTALWVKRDDMTGGAESGNKIRKLEYLFADAERAGATTVVTCGGLQSNHARATAIIARQLGMRPVLMLRSAQVQPPPPLDAGNAFLDALVGAEVRHVTPAQYRERTLLMRELADELERTGERVYVIPEGGSCGLGALGYVDAMAELRAQLDAGEAQAPLRFDAVVVACGSGGTTAGVALGAGRHAIAEQTLAFAVCDDRPYFERVTSQIAMEAQALLDAPNAPNHVRLIDEFKGPAYGVVSDDQARFIVDVARASGLVLDPVYTGKALYGLAHMQSKPSRALFIHTGGLPGLLAQASDLSRWL